MLLQITLQHNTATNKHNKGKEIKTARYNGAEEQPQPNKAPSQTSESAAWSHLGSRPQSGNRRKGYGTLSTTRSCRQPPHSDHQWVGNLLRRRSFQEGNDAIAPPPPGPEKDQGFSPRAPRRKPPTMTPPRRGTAFESVAVTGTDAVGQSFLLGSNHLPPNVH